MRRVIQSAFTLVELLIVIAIIALLIAIMLPAIQAARESGRRAVCANHLWQLGRAVHTYSERRDEMPKYYGKNESILSDSSWYVFLLPYLEQQPLYDQMSGQTDGEVTTTVVTPADPNCVPVASIPGTYYTTRKRVQVPGSGGSYQKPIPRPGFGWSESATTPPEYIEVEVDPPTASSSKPSNAIAGYWDPAPVPGKSCGPSSSTTRHGFKGKYTAIDAVFEPLLCPSDPRTDRFSYFAYGNMALTNYQANIHAFTLSLPVPWTSTATKASRLDAVSVQDGLSNTIFFAEGHRMCSPYTKSNSQWGARVAFWSKREYHSFGVDWHGMPNTYMFQTAPKSTDCNSWRMQTMHGNSLQALFGDGSVRQIANTVSYAEQTDPNDVTPGAMIVMGPTRGTWDRLMLPNDGEPAGLE